jgi:hypothetical protein
VSRDKYGVSLALSWPPKVQKTILEQARLHGEKQEFGARSTAGHYAAGRDNSIWEGIMSAFSTLHAPATTFLVEKTGVSLGADSGLFVFR